MRRYENYLYLLLRVLSILVMGDLMQDMPYALELEMARIADTSSVHSQCRTNCPEPELEIRRIFDNEQASVYASYTLAPQSVARRGYSSSRSKAAAAWSADLRDGRYELREERQVTTC
jgi:hypothetical protein